MMNLVSYRMVNAETSDPGITISSTSAVIMEGSTGTIIYEKDKDMELKPASITKIMTLILIFEAIDSGKISLTDEVTVSEYAASMGGSQVYLEPNETQTVQTMIKCISIASANDASVAMAEYIDGSVESFVSHMNQKAKELGMNHTNFVNPCGLDVENHYSSAYDVALMSRELIIMHPEISEYSTVWMDTIVHTTRKGQSEFGLTNTNKLIKYYTGITGLKTGSTGLAKYCLSATANRDGMDLIAVIMAAPDTKTRFNEAAKLLDYGFANVSLYSDDNKDLVVTPIPITRGIADFITYDTKEKFTYLCLKDTNPSDITKQINRMEKLEAPIKKNDKVGEIVYYMNGNIIGKIDLLASITIARAGYKDYFIKLLDEFIY